MSLIRNLLSLQLIIWVTVLTYIIIETFLWAQDTSKIYQWYDNQLTVTNPVIDCSCSTLVIRLFISICFSIKRRTLLFSLCVLVTQFFLFFCKWYEVFLFWTFACIFVCWLWCLHISLYQWRGLCFIFWCEKYDFCVYWYLIVLYLFACW